MISGGGKLSPDTIIIPLVSSVVLVTNTTHLRLTSLKSNTSIQIHRHPIPHKVVFSILRPHIGCHFKTEKIIVHIIVTQASYNHSTAMIHIDYTFAAKRYFTYNKFRNRGRK
jgi:hypothetical protein